MIHEYYFKVSINTECKITRVQQIYLRVKTLKIPTIQLYAILIVNVKRWKKQKCKVTCDKGLFGKVY